ncbi:hypothetical protein NFI08_19100 [Halomonas sp. EF61]|uniref:hypothetical protein n=1 Tax=Halomonas sp. EF61 TaxID=2950869 RepID=UPI0032E00162
MSYNNLIEQWITKRKHAVNTDIFKSKITAAGVARQNNLTASESEVWVEKAQRRM